MNIANCILYYTLYLHFLLPLQIPKYYSQFINLCLFAETLLIPTSKMAMNRARANVRLPPEVNRVLYVRNLPYKITSEEM